MEKELKELGIEFHLLLGEPKEVLPEFIKNHEVGGLVTDFTPLREIQKWVKDVKREIPSNVPMCQVNRFLSLYKYK